MSKVGTIGELTNIALDVPYVQDAITFFQKFSHPCNTMLLMTAEVDTKKQQKSLILLQSSVRICAYKRKVSFHALNSNGMNLLHMLEENFKQRYELTTKENELTIVIKATEREVNEDLRLKQVCLFSPLRELIAEINCLGKKEDLFIAGNFSFDLFETYEDLPQVKRGDSSCPHYTLYVSQLLLEVNHQTGKSQLRASVFSGKDFERNHRDLSAHMQELKIRMSNEKETGYIRSGDMVRQFYKVNLSDEEFINRVKQIKERIVEGDIFQAVVSRVFSVPCPDSLAGFRKLVELNPSPYMFFMRDESFELFGASPESALKYENSSRVVEMYPIAGTRKRGLNEQKKIDLDIDGRIEFELRTNDKEVAEHMMLVDLARNDLAKICETGSRYVHPLMKVDRYQRVMHLVSQVQGKLKDDLDALHAYQATMNMGTLTGAPKIKATAIIREMEECERGAYGGAVGYLNGAGDMDTCIVIRSATVKNGVAYVQAGAGVVYDSDPLSEAQETVDKAYSVLMALNASEGEV